jgi:hypothetical protein
MLKKLLLALCCLFLFFGQPRAEEAKHYQLLPFSDRAASCHVNQAATSTSCMISEVLVLKPTNEFAICSAFFEIHERMLKFSSSPATSCKPIHCSTCDLIPPISPTDNRLELYRPVGILHSPAADAATYWAVNEQTGVLTVCGIDPPSAECQTVKP